MDQAEKLRSVVKLKKQNYKPDARVITVWYVLTLPTAAGEKVALESRMWL